MAVRVAALCSSLVLAALVALAAVGAPAGTIGAAGPAPAASYVLDAVVDLDAATVAVGESVRVRNAVGTPLDSLVFQAVPNALSVFTLGAATVDGQPVVPRLDGSVLELPLATPLAPGAQADVALQFSLAVPSRPDRLAATERGITLGFWFPMLAVHRGGWDRRQFVDVGDAHFSEVADFDLTVTTNRPAQVVATGQRVEQAAGRSRFRAASVRDVAVAISTGYVTRRAASGASIVEAAAYGDDRAAFYARRTPEVLAWAAGRFGAYPYPTLAIADADLPASFGGLEYPGLVLLARGIGLAASPDGGSLDALLVHEVLHQWFYALVGNDQLADPWLDEAFVTYLTYQFYRDVAPALAASVYERTIAGGGSGPVDASVYDFPSDAPYFGQVYRRGARFLAALHARLGDDLFWQLMREHVETNRDRVASPRAFLDRAQALSPTPLAPLIAEYFTYAAFRTPTPRPWTLELPASPWTGTADLFVAADFPVTRVQLWLDSRMLADGPENAIRLDLTGVEAGSYVLLVRVWDHDAIVFERARRVEIAP